MRRTSASYAPAPVISTAHRQEDAYQHAIRNAATPPISSALRRPAPRSFETPAARSCVTRQPRSPANARSASKSFGAAEAAIERSERLRTP